MRFHAALFCILVLVGCRSHAGPSPTPTLPQLTGIVSIEAPATGALIYAEVIQFSGTASDLPADQFVLTLTGPDETELAHSLVNVTDGHWQVEIPHSYQDEPIEVAVAAEATETSIDTPYDIVLIALGGLAYRPPEATYGRITFPIEGSTAGGDSLQVEGLASGIPDNRLTVRLLDTDAQLINEQIITIHDPYIIDEMPWSAEVATNGYIGPASLEIATSDAAVLATTQLAIDRVAG